MELRRIENFRKGDRAEKLGIFLLQSFCAIAEVPRQEDFGLVDAVATLLRRQERFLIAEDSFLIQFKSRTETTVELLDGRFKALVALDLPLFLGHVNLHAACLEIHTLGVALAHPNFNDCSGIVAYLQSSPDAPGIKENVLHLPLTKPILRITIGDIESSEFTNKAYEVLKEWLNIERWNRRHRRSGKARLIAWETNDIPIGSTICCSWDPLKAQEALQDFVPFITLLTTHARSNPQLRGPTLAIISWLRSHGVEPDPSGIFDMVIRDAEAYDLLDKVLNEHPDADFACTFRVEGAADDHLNFRLVSRNRSGAGDSEPYAGSLAQIREKGFVAQVELLGDRVHVNLDFSEQWLSLHHRQPAIPSHVAVHSTNGLQTVDVLLLREHRTETQESAK